ncbi:phosphoribosylanthranilate isomerase [Gammaproteobacteria bacterium]|jgi:phosphoribosylanthranilate isomerase|nr:phosphoribosylanthranilate isomerase [Gammaproteobacteria bacterium]MDA8924558.1 phosphoribosylanthranilate isomerase [Gammaproteobacteria bacterium]MDA9049142.1 phosphoribosylanthranilate isomerase [Gammaproteobacteria bacterium]MDA9154016.1 phosphoribosylanthranilate isomerase [Gammaproteobacteria bacterium]MDA9340808.1 phosphoribosylanthranilate isomerase [Gammaproteobacteria bacterium]|tara:strand:+ start:12769 stop:13383 length:615 start_codon:yes stop_codon:yes gene_type:complete
MKLKFCGLQTLESLQHACDLGADYAGFIFAEKSPRKVSQEFLEQLSLFNFRNTLPVCVFVNPSPSFVEQVVEFLPTAILQFHGDESDSFCSQFKKPYWKSIPIKDASSISLILSDPYPSAEAILLETFSSNLNGGTGKSFDWTLIQGADLSKKFILAGGINEANIDAAISLNPWCIDINSGVESQLALKDTLLMTQMIKRFNNG